MDATRCTSWVPRFDREMAHGKVAAALITSMYGLDLAPPALKRMPRPQAETLTNMAMDSEDKQTADDTVTMRKLAPTCAGRGCCSPRWPAPPSRLLRDSGRAISPPPACSLGPPAIGPFPDRA